VSEDIYRHEDDTPPEYSVVVPVDGEGVIEFIVRAWSIEEAIQKAEQGEVESVLTVLPGVDFNTAEVEELL